MYALLRYYNTYYIDALIDIGIMYICYHNQSLELMCVYVDYKQIIILSMYIFCAF